MARQEWARQDRLRHEQATVDREKLSDNYREVCSTVDRVLAYRLAAIFIFESRPVYFVGIEAIRRINLNVSILKDMLQVFLARTELTDGAVYSVAAALRLANFVIAETNSVLTAWGHQDPDWSGRVAALKTLDELARMVELRSQGVRASWKLDSQSSVAKKIHDKYNSLAEALKAAVISDSGAPDIDLTGDYL